MIGTENVITLGDFVLNLERIGDDSLPRAIFVICCLGGRFEPCEILLVVSADSPLSFALGGQVKAVRLGQGEHPNVAVNSIAGRAMGSYLLVLDAGTALAPEALAWFAVASEDPRSH